MTKEQKEAIERLNKDKNKPLACGDITIVIIEDIETVLDMLKEKDKYIEFYKNGLEREIESNRENIVEIIKKDKQIDLMSRAIDNYDSQLAINTFRDKEHVKQYFAGLVEKE